MEAFSAFLGGYHIFLWSCYIFCGFLLGISSTNELFTHTVTKSGTIILDCSTSITLASTWIFDDNAINFNRVIWDERFKQNSFITANYSLRIQNVSVEQEGMYQCTNDSHILSSHSIKVEVIPTVHLTVNNVHPEYSYVIVPRNENVIATCVASSARPPVNITWFVNNTKVKSFPIVHQAIVTNNKSNDTFDTLSSISFQPYGETGNITCVIDGLSENGLFAQVKFKVEMDQWIKNDTQASSTLKPSTNEDAITLSISLITIVTLSAAIILICLVVVACIAKKVKGSPQPHVYTNQTIPLESSCAGSVDSERVTVHLPKSCADYSRRLGPELTNIPEEYAANDPAYSFLPEFEGDFKLQDMTPKSRNFNAKEMSLLLKIKTGPVYTRWMGTVSIDSENTKSVVISTITDRTLKTKEIHWQEYVKRVLDLPRNENLVSVVGICIDSVSLYLLHENIVGETLNKRILTRNTVDCNNMNLVTPSEALLYVRGILEGMELVHSYGFLHPGLTTKKIPVTDEGACKLYDFCLDMDADKRVAVAKTQTICNLNQFAPEALQKNIYTKECDVWSVGVVIWEIFSGGSHPFPSTDESISSLDKLPSPPDEWPGQYRTLRNRRVFDCWEEEASLRPSLNQLRLSFSKISKSLQSCGDREIVPAQNGPLASEEFCYTTMTGNNYD